MGPGTLEVPTALFSNNRKRLVDRLKGLNVEKGSVVLLQGGSEVPFNDTDTEYLYRQVSTGPIKSIQRLHTHLTGSTVFETILRVNHRYGCR